MFSPLLGLVHARQVYFLAVAVDIFRNFIKVSFWVQRQRSPAAHLVRRTVRRLVQRFHFPGISSL